MSRPKKFWVDAHRLVRMSDDFEMPEVWHRTTKRWVHWPDFNDFESHEVSAKEAAEMADGPESLTWPVYEGWKMRPDGSYYDEAWESDAPTEGEGGGSS